jgi:peroxiredoxin
MIFEKSAFPFHGFMDFLFKKMKLFFSLILLCAIASGTLAQDLPVKSDSVSHSAKGGFTLPANTKYVLPDGKIVNNAGFDSARRAWGGTFSMRHDLAHPDVIKVYPVTAAALKSSAEEKAAQATLLNQPAPEFSLKDVNGKQYDLKQLKGKVVVLNFWFIGCAPCMAEMPELNLIRNTPDFSSVIFLSVGLDKAAAIKKFLKSTKFQYTPLTDGRATHQAYKVTTCPTSMVIDKNGIVRFIQVTGEEIGHTLPPAIKAVL